MLHNVLDTGVESKKRNPALVSDTMIQKLPLRICVWRDRSNSKQNVTKPIKHDFFFHNTNVLDTEFSKRNENLFHSQIKGVGAQHKK